jgi:hypothetical protein
MRAQSRPASGPLSHVRRLFVGALASACFAVVLLPASQAGAANHDQSELEAQLLQAVRDANFGEVIDFGPFEDVCPGAGFCAVPAHRVGNAPNVDLAVIELDADGHATRAANVLVSRDYPTGVVVPLDQQGGAAGTFGTTSVRWRRWDIERHDGGTFDQKTGKQLTTKGWTDDPPFTAADDIVPGRENAPLQFMEPYPASLFKIMVAFRIMRLVDMGRLSLDQVVAWDPTPTAGVSADPGSVSADPGSGPAANGVTNPGDSAAGNVGADPGNSATGGGQAVPPGTPPTTAPVDDSVSRSLRDWMDRMITYSDNDSGRALLHLLSDLHDLPAMNAELRGLGLGTLQIEGIDPETGGNWQPGQINMTSLDTARLLWLIDGGKDTLWTRPDGQPVKPSILSDTSRAFLEKLLAEQGYHEALSSTNLCGAPNTRPGIPAKVPTRWINPDGTVTVDGYPYGADVEPCNASAEVIFGHKTGDTFNYGSDAGIVRSLPGKPGRHYVISFVSSLGYRYTDPVFASRSSYPCYDAIGPICYVQSVPALGKQIDDYLRSGS